MGNCCSTESPKPERQPEKTPAPQTDAKIAETTVAIPEDRATPKDPVAPVESASATVQVTETEASPIAAAEAVPVKPPSQWTETDKADKATVLAAVKVNGCDVQYSSDELKDDFDIGLAAIKAFTPAFVYLGPKVRFPANQFLITAEYIFIDYTTIVGQG